MKTLVDNPALGVALVILGAVLLFLPTFVGHFRRIRAFRSVSALNALAFLLVIGFLVPGLLFWGVWPPSLWGALASWAAAAVWSAAGRRGET